MTSAAVPAAPRRISLLHLALAAPWILVVTDAFRRVNDNSFLWHVEAGHLQRGAGEVLTADPFSFTVLGEPWLTQSWLAELVYSVGDGAMGLQFVGPMMLVLLTLTFVGVAVIAYRWSSSLLATVVVTLLTSVIALPFLVPRPAVFSYPLFVLVILAWDRPQTRWTVPFVMWLWASVHGSFAVGLAYLLLMVIAKKEWRAWPHLLAAGSACLVTAHGLGVVTVLMDFITARPYLDIMQEWSTPDFLAPQLVPFVIGIVIMIYGASKGRLEARWLWIITPFLFLAASASRAVFTAWLGLVPFIAFGLKGAVLRWGRGFARPIGVVILGLIMIVPLLFTTPVTLNEDVFPVAAETYIEDVRTFHDDYAGGYFIYSSAFTDGVFIDDRAELYRERIQEFVEVRAGIVPWEEVFERDGIEQALLRPGQVLVDDLRDAGWVVTYEDKEYLVLRPA